MIRALLRLGVPALIILPVYAQSVQIWQTRFDQGTTRERERGFNGFDEHQDEGYELLRQHPELHFSNQPSAHPTKIRIDPQRNYQKIVGLGAALTDSSAYLLSQLKQQNPKLYRFVLRRLFSEDGAGFQALRRPIGSSDFTATKQSYSYADQRSEDLSTFTIEHDRRYIIPVLKDILTINPKITIIASPWSAPAWMKGNRDLHGLTADEKNRGTNARLRPQYFGIYADYFVKFIQGYAEEGITIHAVTLQNEPQFDAASYPCMRMTADDQIALVRALGPKLKAAKLNTQVFIHDHNWTLHLDDLVIVGSDVKVEPYNLVSHILKDPIAGNYVAGTAWHCYAGNAGVMRDLYRRLANEFPEKLIYTTEATGWRDFGRTDWTENCAWGLRHNWLGSLAAGSAMSLQWNLVLDHKHGPTTRTDSRAVGLVTLNTDTWQSARFEREYYAMAHVAKTIGTSATRLHMDLANGDDLMALAVRRTGGGIGLVICNPDQQTVGLDVACTGRHLALQIPAQSIVTLVWHDS
jgi:glucosylceramidase